MTYTPVKSVTEEAARAVRAAVIEHFRVYTHAENGQPLPAEDLPVLRAPNTGWGAHWVLGWEGGAPYEWPCLFTSGGVNEFTQASVAPAEQPEGVFCEPINGLELGIYPSHD